MQGIFKIILSQERPEASRDTAETQGCDPPWRRTSQEASGRHALFLWAQAQRRIPAVTSSGRSGSTNRMATPASVLLTT